MLKLNKKDEIVKLYYEDNLTQKEMKINNSGIFITSENKEVTDSFFEVLKKNDCKLMKKEIDNISTKEDPIVYLKHYSDVKDEECSYYTRLLYIKNNAEMNNYNFDMHFNPCPDGYNNIWVEFFVLADLPTIEFSSQKIIIKKLKKSRK